MAQERSVKFVKLMQFSSFNIRLEDVEGAINAELEALQAISTVRIDTVHSHPLFDTVTGSCLYFAFITGRRITRDQPPADQIPPAPNGIPPLLVVSPDLYEAGCAESS